MTTPHQKCEALDKVLREAWAKRNGFSWEDEAAEVKEVFPTDDELRVWYKYRIQKAKDLFNTTYEPISRDEVYQRTMETDFTLMGDVQDLTALFIEQAQPLMPLGVRDGVPYQIAPDVLTLHPHEKRTSADCFEDYLLGARMDVTTPHAAAQLGFPKSRKRRREASSEDSLEATDSTDVASSREAGFCFFQLGRMQEYVDDNWDAVKSNELEAAKGYWVDTPYVVVTEVSSDGKCGPLWIIYNTHPEVESDSTEGSHVIHVGASDDEILETLETPPRPIMMCKIASALSEIQGDQALTRPLQFVDSTVEEDEPYLVRAKVVGLKGDIVHASKPAAS